VRIPLGKDHLHPEDIDHSMELQTEKIKTELTDREQVSVLSHTPVRSKTKYRILVVEDDEEIRNYLYQELGNDFHIQECNNGKDALATILKKAPDLVITDVMMPEMDGMTLCKKIKQNVNINHIPVILLTARTREEDTMEGLQHGADAYITKPFNVEILRQNAMNLIKGRELLKNNFTGNQVQEEKIKKIEAESPDERLLKRVMKVINDNMSNSNLNVEMIAAEVGISRVHLHRKLKELTNQSTRDFIRNVRLKQAADLLAEKKHSVSEVAALTGFTNLTYFSTVFKDTYGVSPSNYTNREQEE
jgi:YesN/AraC family two-component response regulator